VLDLPSNGPKMRAIFTLIFEKSEFGRCYNTLPVMKLIEEFIDGTV
jgi:hypothetical protein